MSDEESGSARPAVGLLDQVGDQRWPGLTGYQDGMVCQAAASLVPVEVLPADGAVRRPWSRQPLVRT
ncbi:hypothetical protein ABZU75_37570 [Streptosporangium sp. NPDC005286]|uniref:hypothetical protein n=1 Tax=Streptosporangium sp. NPDC005286 TaxID=3154463 RepID=UPI0033BF0443